MDVKQEPPAPSQNDSPKKRKAVAVAGEGDAREGKRNKKPWTEEEEDIFIELIKSALTQEKVWALAKEDGKLAHRGSNGIRGHVASMLKKISK